MDEARYREAYRDINRWPCPFEPAILTRRCGCRRHRRLLLAEREAVACDGPDPRARCAAFLAELRERGRFALGLTRIDGPLPHGKEIKVQAGGLLGLQVELGGEAAGQVADVDALLEAALARWGALDRLPFEALARHVLRFRPRNRRRGG